MSKPTWAKTTLWFSVLQASKRPTRIFSRKELIGNYLNDIIAAVNCAGRTPQQTLSRVLQELRDAGLIEFKSKGVYRLLVDHAEALAYLKTLSKGKISSGERLVSSILDSLGVNYQREKTFMDMRAKDLLRFDFYFERAGSKYAIEYDGIQHSIAVEFFGGIPKLIETINRDKIKDNYAAKNDIKLLRIDYKESLAAVTEKIKKHINADKTLSTPMGHDCKISLALHGGQNVEDSVIINNSIVDK